MTETTNQPLDRFAPVDVLVVEIPDGEVTPDIFVPLLELVERKVIRVLDLEFVRRHDDGDVSLIDVTSIPAGPGVDFGYLEGASSGLLDEDDLAYIGDIIEPGSIAGVLLFEHVWMVPMADTIETNGARIAAWGQVDLQDLFAALDSE
ncbi:MAG TPA: DUF6325 family protein [Actinomycetaceae bacterium]|nr:DUF6325 family protein [Actinomycetaceae bacterium]